MDRLDEASVAGKKVFMYVPKGNKSYTHRDISQYLKRFKLSDALILIGQFSHNIFNHKEGIPTYNGMPITIGILAYLAMHLVEDSNDYRSSKMQDEDLLKAIDMYYGLADPFIENNANPSGGLLRAGAAQFYYDRQTRHALARIWVIYQEIWPQVEEAKNLDISDALQELIGISLLELLGLSFTFFSTAHKGYLQAIDDLEQFPEPLRTILESEKQKAFLNWISCGYQDFRNLSKKDEPPSDAYEHFRFNPLYVKPALIPDRSPKQGVGPVYITPVPHLIMERTTNGLYFALSDYFKASTGGQSFRNAFGHVFQEYVGKLLKQAFKEENVIPEWKYNNNKLDTPDWIVICDGRAIVFEVKQAGLYLTSKKWAEEEEIKKDLKRTIGKGALQMLKFQDDIDSGLCQIPEVLKGIAIVEKMVVTFDHSYFLNSIIRDKVRLICPGLRPSYHWHTITVEDLEYVLGHTKSSMTDFLEKKRCNPSYDQMEFKDYQAHMRADAGNTTELKNIYLDSVVMDIFCSMGLEDLAAEVPTL